MTDDFKKRFCEEYNELVLPKEKAIITLTEVNKIDIERVNRKIRLQEDLDLIFNNRLSVIECRITKLEMTDQENEPVKITGLLDKVGNAYEEHAKSVDKRPQPIPDFTAMHFEELMSTQHKPDNDKFNEALWSEKSNRLKKLGIADRDLFEDVSKYQDEIADRVNKLELKLSALITMAEENSHLKVPCKNRFSL